MELHDWLHEWDLNHVAMMRYRTTLVQERARVVNRVQKLLEGANIKLSSVALDVMGV